MSVSAITSSSYNSPCYCSNRLRSPVKENEPRDKAGVKPLSEEEKKEVEKLKNLDREVKAHEQAHMAAGAGVVRGGPHYEYQKGPDGQSYAVGGEVSIDTSEGKTPIDTLMKMERVRAAAMAPANPSGQDLSVAATASSKAAEARVEMSEEKREGAKGGKGAARGEQTALPGAVTPKANAAYQNQSKNNPAANPSSLIAISV